MSEVRFPKRREDGTFCVEVTLAVQTAEPEGLLHRVRAWASRWIEVNRVWEWKWDTGGAEELHYEREFGSGPEPVSCTTTELRMRLEGLPTAGRWKDWIVWRIVPELKAAFPEVQDVCGVKDCE